MALSRRTGARFQASIWPGFVDAMTGLLLVLMFVLTIFMMVQFVLRETITGQEAELNDLAGEVAALAQALGLEEQSGNQLDARINELNATLNETRDQATAQATVIANLMAQRDDQAQRLTEAGRQITTFEAQVAGLLAQREDALNTISTLETEQTRLISEQEALNLALAASRTEIDAQSEAARLAASKLEALIADLETEGLQAEDRVLALEQQLAATADALSEEEAAKLVEAAVAEALRARLEIADAELTAMTLSLESKRREAEETLTLLAAARAAQGDLNAQLVALLSQLDSGTSETQAIQIELQTALQDAETLRSQLSTTDQSALEIQAQLAAADQRISDLQAQVASGGQTTAEIQAQLVTANQRASNLQAQVSSTTETAAEIQTKLTAALAAKLAAEQTSRDLLTAAEQQSLLLETAESAFSQERVTSAAAQRQTELLNQQVAALRTQLNELSDLLNLAEQREQESQVQLQSLGSTLNTALARAVAEERRRRVLEEQGRKRLEAETQDLAQYRSEFFGRLRDLLGTQEGVRIEGDRFVFSSEVLFPPGVADLSQLGEGEIAKIAVILRGVADEIPPEIDWVIRVDGHTDNVPLSGLGEFADNWELSQARALSVVKYMATFLGIPPSRLAANGFGQYQPVNLTDTPEARAQNRRIELKFTEK